jgi:hypothetical protein
LIELAHFFTFEIESMLQHIQIIGGPESGTYRAGKLSEHLNIPAYDLDLY